MTKLVGILNITPDSFSDGGQFLAADAAVKQARQLFADGAALVDIGAESTRPNAASISLEEEWQRLEPVLKILILEFPGKISLDSYHPETVRKAFAIEPVIINDVTGMNNPEMIDAATDLKATVIISHLPGSNIQAAHLTTPIHDIETVKHELLTKADLLISKGLLKDQIILDPGIGFGKTMELNWELLKFAEQVPDLAVMIGYSRKRFLGDQRMELAPNLDAAKVAIAHGAAYLRVHDVQGHASL